MNKLFRVNSISPDVFAINAQSEENKGDRARARLLASGRLLMKEHAMRSLSGQLESVNSVEYNKLNDEFAKERVLFAAKIACNAVGREVPETYDDFMKEALRFRGDATFLKALQGVDEDVVYPILPATYADALDVFADVVDVPYGTTKVITVGSNDIPYFCDSSWGATRNVPLNQLYDKTYTLNPQPKAAKIGVKWTQLIGNGLDFGRYYNAMAAGMYAKTMAMFQNALVNASTNTALIPSSMQITYSSPNFIALANTVAALNNCGIDQLVCYGNYVPLSKILPNTVTGASNVNMDAAIMMLLGKEYVSKGYIGEAYGVKLLPLRDAIKPGTQNGTPTTILPNDRAWIMASNGYKPMTIAMNSNTPLTLEYSWEQSASGDDVTINVVSSLDIVVTMASKMGTISGL